MDECKKFADEGQEAMEKGEAILWDLQGCESSLMQHVLIFLLFMYIIL